MKTILFLLCAAVSISAQYELRKSVAANGGGDVSGGSYSGTTTVGQPVVGGYITFDISALYTGFWSPGFAPTAAGVSISGRVLASEGVGLGNAAIYLTKQNGETLAARTSGFGFYRFDDVEAGQTVIITVTSRRYVFSPRTLSLQENVADIDFLPLNGKY